MRRVLYGIVIGAVVLAVGLAGCAALLDNGVKVNLVWDGDSQSAPVPNLVVPAEVAADQVHPRAKVHTLATTGADLPVIASRASDVDELLADANHNRNVLVLWAGTNDLGTGKDPATAVAELAAYTNARRKGGWTVVVLTALPRTYGVDVPGYEQRRLAFNEQVRQQWSEFADHLVDVATLSEIGDDSDQLDQAFYLPDTLHLNSAGRQLVGTAVGKVLAAI